MFKYGFNIGSPENQKIVKIKASGITAAREELVKILQTKLKFSKSVAKKLAKKYLVVSIDIIKPKTPKKAKAKAKNKN